MALTGRIEHSAFSEDTFFGKGLKEILGRLRVEDRLVSQGFFCIRKLGKGEARKVTALVRELLDGFAHRDAGAQRLCHSLEANPAVLGEKAMPQPRDSGSGGRIALYGSVDVQITFTVEA